MAIDDWVPTSDGKGPFYGIDRDESPVRFTLAERPSPRDIVYEVRVLRQRDGTTVITGGDHGLPESWEDRHRMLVDALGEVKRQAGVTHGRPFWEEQPAGTFGGQPIQPPLYEYGTERAGMPATVEDEEP